MPYKQPNAENVKALQEAVEAFLMSSRGFGSDIWDGYALDSFPAQMLCAALEAKDPQLLYVITSITGNFPIASITKMEITEAEERGYLRGFKQAIAEVLAKVGMMK